MYRRIGLHIAFWLAYWLLTGYIESVLAGSSFSDWTLFAKLRLGYTVELFTLPLKMAAVYWFLYRLLPGHVAGRAAGSVMVEGTAVILAAVMLYRLLVQHVIFPYLYHMPYESGSLAYQASRFLWSFLDIVYVMGIAVAIRMARLRIQALKREKQLVEEKLQSELRFLRAQANPHFLFNTLNNIYGMARKQSPQTAEVVLKLSKLLRYMLYECTADTVPLSKEVEVAENFIELEKLRYGKRLVVHFQKEADCLHYPIAPLLLLPLVENAFKHGSGESRFDCRIDISLALEGGLLSFRVSNTCDEPARETTAGIGLQNLRRQLELLYPGSHRLEAGFEAGLFVAVLQLGNPKTKGASNTNASLT